MVGAVVWGLWHIQENGYWLKWRPAEDDQGHGEDIAEPDEDQNAVRDLGEAFLSLDLTD